MAKVFLILADKMGRGDEELGSLLLKNLLYSLARDERPPARVLFANSGVRLACEGSDSLEDLEMLVGKGVGVGACGTCLDHMGLTGSLAVGEVATMPDAVSLM